MKTVDIELLARAEVDRCFRQKTLLQQAASEEAISKAKAKVALKVLVMARDFQRISWRLDTGMN